MNPAELSPEYIKEATEQLKRDMRRNANEVRLQRLEWLDNHTPYHEVVSIADRLAVLAHENLMKWKIVKELRLRSVIPQPCRRRHRRKRKK